MPQMSPMLWMNLYLYFIILMIIMMMMIYNIYFMKIIFNKSTFKLNMFYFKLLW